METKAFQLEGHMMVPTLKNDGSVTLKFATPELTKEEINILLDNKMKVGWVLFSPNEIQVEDIPDKEAEMETKSPTKMLYNRMLRYYMTAIDKKGEGFNEWRTKQMLQIGQKYLDKLM